MRLRLGSDRALWLVRAFPYTDAWKRGHGPGAHEGAESEMHFHWTAPVWPINMRFANARVSGRIVNAKVCGNRCWAENAMNRELTLALLLVAAVIVWVIAKVVRYAKLSERQWQQVDREKLRKWEDEVD